MRHTYFWVKIGWVPPYLAIFRHFSWNFANFENFYNCLHFSRGKKIFFFQKWPKNGLDLVLEKKIQIKVCHLHQLKPEITNVIFFYEGFPKTDKQDIWHLELLPEQKSFYHNIKLENSTLNSNRKIITYIKDLCY